MIYLGIDPGKKGGIAVIDGGTANAAPYSDTELMQICNRLHKDTARAAIEKVHAMPGQGVTSMFSFGQSVGYIKGVLEANGIAYQEIPPQTWKKEFGLNTDKQKSIDVCRRLFPAVSLRATPRCTTDHDGMAEALLIAEYAKRKL